MSEHDAQIFSEGDFHDGTLVWGWQCFVCHEEDGGYGSATRASEECDNHVSICTPSRPVADNRQETP